MTADTGIDETSDQGGMWGRVVVGVDGSADALCVPCVPHAHCTVTVVPPIP